VIFFQLKVYSISYLLTLRKIVILNGTEWSEESQCLQLVQFGDISLRSI